MKVCLNQKLVERCCKLFVINCYYFSAYGFRLSHLLGHVNFEIIDLCISIKQVHVFV